MSEPRTNIIQHLHYPTREEYEAARARDIHLGPTITYECGWHHLPMPDNRCPKCITYPSYEAMLADLTADKTTEAQK